jgi:hypothetical protein
VSEATIIQNLKASKILDDIKVGDKTLGDLNDIAGYFIRNAAVDRPKDLAKDQFNQSLTDAGIAETIDDDEMTAINSEAHDGLWPTIKEKISEIYKDLAGDAKPITPSSDSCGNLTTRLIATGASDKNKEGLVTTYLLGKMLSEQDKASMLKCYRKSVTLMPELFFSAQITNFTIRRFSFDEAQLIIVSPGFLNKLTSKIINNGWFMNFSTNYVPCTLAPTSTDSSLDTIFGTACDAKVDKTKFANYKVKESTPSFVGRIRPSYYTRSGLVSWFSKDYSIDFKVIAGSQKFGMRGLLIGFDSKNGVNYLRMGINHKYNGQKLASSSI